MKPSGMKSILQITKALADMQRVRILFMLQGRELCVCQIIAVLDLAPSTISKHLSILNSAGLVEHRKEGRWAYYRLPGSSADISARSATKWLIDSLREDAMMKEDMKRLSRVLRHDPKVICSQQRKG